VQEQQMLIKKINDLVVEQSNDRLKYLSTLQNPDRRVRREIVKAVDLFLVYAVSNNKAESKLIDEIGRNLMATQLNFFTVPHLKALYLQIAKTLAESTEDSRQFKLKCISGLSSKLLKAQLVQMTIDMLVSMPVVAQQKLIQSINQHALEVMDVRSDVARSRRDEWKEKYAMISIYDSLKPFEGHNGPVYLSDGVYINPDGSLSHDL
jgi:hypothetical protein